MFYRFLAVSTAIVTAALISNPLTAQEFPTRPVTIIVAQPPGGGTDIISPIVGEQLSKQLGQPVIIANRPGAGTVVGTVAAANAPPDGYTMLAGLIAKTALILGSFGWHEPHVGLLTASQIASASVASFFCRLT